MSASSGNSETMLLVQAELRPDEKLLWSDRRQPSLLSPETFGMLSAGIGMGVFGPCMIIATFKWDLGSLSLFWIFMGVLFIVSGAAALGSSMLGQMDARRMIYAVTDTRLIVMQTGRTRSVTSYLPEDVGRVERKDSGTRVGSIKFAPILRKDGNGQVRITEEKGFLEIPNALEVERLILAFRQSAVGFTSKPN